MESSPYQTLQEYYLNNSNNRVIISIRNNADDEVKHDFKVDLNSDIPLTAAYFYAAAVLVEKIHMPNGS